MKSKIYSNEYIKATSKGTLWIPVFLTIGFLMAFPVAELIKLGNWFGLEYTRAQIGLLYENLWKDGFLTTGYVVVMFAAVINGISQFWYLYSARKVDFYHCLPVKKSGMFWHKTYVGILYYLTPYVVMEFLTVCIGAMRGFFSLHLMKLALIMLLFHFLLYLLFYFCIVLVISMTGNLLMGGLCLAGVAIYGPLVSNTIASYQGSFFKTFANTSYGICKFFYDYVSPVRLGMVSINRYSSGKCGAAVLMLLAVTVVLGIASYFAYVKRPFEKTGKALIYSWTAVIVRFLVVIPCGLMIGILFYSIPINDNSRIPWWIFGMIVGTVLTHGILEVIIQMDFKKFLGHKLQLVLAGAGVAVCALNFQFDLQGYDTYVPKYDKIASVYSNLGILGEYFYDMTEDDGYYTVKDGRNGYGEEGGYDIGISQDIYKVLKEAAAWTKQGNYEEEYNHSFSVQYLLKSGKSIYRGYSMTEGQIEELLTACYAEGTLKSVKYSPLKLDTKYLKRVTGTFCTGMEYTLFQDDSKKRSELIEALKEDVKEASPETLTGMPCAMLALNYEGVPQVSTITAMVPGHSSIRFINCGYYVYPEFKRTIAILKETGYPLSLDEVSLDKVEVRYWIGGSSEETEPITYVEQEQLQEIKKALVNSALCPAWKPYVCNWSALSVTIDGNENLGGWLMSEELYPEFMKKDEKEARPELVKAAGTGEAYEG